MSERSTPDERLSAEQPTGSSPHGAAERDRRIARVLAIFLAVMAGLLLVALPLAVLTVDRVLQLAASVTLGLVAAVFFRMSRAR